MKANEQTFGNKRKRFDKFQLDFTNPLTIRSKQDYLQYTTEVINPSQVINLLETDEDLFNLLNESELQFEKQQLRVTFKIANKTKALVIQFKKRSADEQISCLASIVEKISLERDQLMNKNSAQQKVINQKAQEYLALQRVNSQKAQQIWSLKKAAAEHDQLLLNKQQALQKVISEQQKEIVALKSTTNRVLQKLIHQQAKQIHTLKQAQSVNCQALKNWHLTHCARCGVKIEINHGNAFGRPSCSVKCFNYVKNNLKAGKIFDFELH